MIKSYLFAAISLGAPLALAAETATAPATLPATQPVAEAAAATLPVATARGDLGPGGATQPATQPGTQPVTLAATQSTTRPSTFAATLPATRPTTNLATSRPSSMPTYASRNGISPPSAAPPAGSNVSKPMPKEYVLLGTRSIFQRGRPPREFILPPSASTEPSSQPYSPRETSLVFNGVTRTDDEVVALLEDLSARTVLKIRVGDPLARGKVSNITLDTLDYEARGRVTHVAIGQTLDGSTAPAASTQPSPIAAGIGAPGSSSTSPSTAPAGLSGSAADMLERLRRKRQQELGGGN